MRPMPQLHLLACISILGLACSAGESPTESRVTRSFDFDWKYSLGDPEGAENPGFDDSSWKTVHLPHDFIAGMACRKDDSSGTKGGYRPLEVGWYRKSFSLPPEMRGKSILLRFDGIMYEADIYLNGEKIGHQSFPYLSTTLDITDEIKERGENLVAVRADASSQRERWYHGGGIYRHTWLTATSPVRVAPFGTYITTPEVSASRATVKVVTELMNSTKGEREVVLETVFLGPDGVEVARDQARATIQAGATTAVEQSLSVNTPKIWDPVEPHLYRALSRVSESGKLVDDYTTTFGIRTFEFTPDRGFVINGRKMMMNGVCLHQDIAPFGSGVPDRAMERQLRKLKAMGVNSIRAAHNPYSIEFLDLCDRLGLIVIDEVFDKWNEMSPNGEGWKEELVHFIRRDRNHPSIVLWSVGNEVLQQNTDEGVELYRAMEAVVRELEPSRPSTAALHPRKQPKLPKIGHEMDVVCQNYSAQIFDEDREKYPDMILLESESLPYYTRNIKTPDEDDKYLEQIPYFFLKEDNCGHFHWTGWEYLGEAVSRWPRAGWTDAMFDMSGRRKSYSWYFEALYRPDTPVVHIGVRDKGAKRRGKSGWDWPATFSHWNWNAGKGEKEVFVFANTHEVELILNDESLGTKKLSDHPERLMSWMVKPEPGTIRAVGRDADGRVVAEHSLQTAGEPEKLELVVEDGSSSMAADGQDLSHIRVRVVDKDGIVVPDAGNRITFEVSGAASLAGVCNGSNRTDVVYSDPEVDAWQGEALAVLRASRQPGPVTLKVSADGLTSASTTLTVKSPE